MRIAATWHAAMWALPLTGSAALVWAALQSPGKAVPPPRVERTTASRSTLPYPVDSLGHVVVARDPFRVARRPAPTAYNPIAAATPEAPPAPKPVLALTGIVWGEVPEAVLEGLPGTDGPRVVRRGETVAGFRIRAIERSHVIVAGLDTVWTLTVREPWR